MTGRPRKREFGPWILPVFRVLARFKGLRGTRWDPFGGSADRRLERRAIADYECLVDEILARLSRDNHAMAVALAALPDDVRGYGLVKQRSFEAAQARQAVLLATLRAEVAPPLAA